MKTNKIALSLLLLSLAGPVFAQNLLVNGNFEADLNTSPTAPTGWTMTNTNSTAGVYNGGYSLPGSGNYFWLNGDPGVVPTLEQTISIIAGQPLVVEAHYGSLVFGTTPGTLLFEFLDTSTSTVLHSATFNPTSGDPTTAASWNHISYVTPSIAASSVRFRISAQVGADDDYRLDNLSVSSAPEPGVLGLLALGAPGLMLLRRRA